MKAHPRPDEGSRGFGIGIGLLPTARGRGVSTWAQQELVRLIFLHTPVNRVEAAADVTSLPEQQALDKTGFTREGVLRGAQWRLGTGTTSCCSPGYEQTPRHHTCRTRTSAPAWAAEQGRDAPL